MADDYRVHSSEVLQHTRVFDLRRDRASHPRRAQGEFYVLEAPAWVNIVAVTTDDALVLVRQWRAGTRKQELEIPGGMVDAGEDPLDAAARELAEETGYVAERLTLIGTSSANPAIMTNHVSTVLAEGCRLRVEVSPDEHEDIDVELMPASTVWEAVRGGHIDHAIVLAGLLHWRLHLEMQRGEETTHSNQVPTKSSSSSAESS